MKMQHGLKSLVLLCILAFAAGPISSFAMDDADIPSDDSAGTVPYTVGDAEITDSDIPLPGEADLMDASGGPIAFGVVYRDGSKQSGTDNWSSLYNSTYKRYEIKINGESYYYLKYTTVITPAGDVRYCRSSSVGGKLLVYCYDKSGSASSTRFGFATFKTN